MDEQKCSYKGCNEHVNSPHHDSLCIFHAPADRKGVTISQFNEIIWRRLNGRNYNFKGYVFPGDIFFRGECLNQGGPFEFGRLANFSDATFEGDVNFREAEFKGDAYFSKVAFKGNVEFYGTRFTGLAYFRRAGFSKEVYFGAANFSGKAIFDNATFSDKVFFGKSTDSVDFYFDISHFSQDVSFYETEFLDDVNFNEVNFPGETVFVNAKFMGNSKFGETYFDKMVDFSGAIFRGDANFNSTQFNEKTSFIDNKFGSKVSFFNVYFAKESTFYFINPKTLAKTHKSENVTILFERIRFIPYSSYFEHIRILMAPLIFRYCQLENVYFANNDMSLFSFYKSSFEQARFISSTWSSQRDNILFIGFNRNNIIPEERFLNEIRRHKYNQQYTDELKNSLKIGELNGYEDVSSLYRRMKTALDYTKDYQQASWFYFNEFEMKRRALQDKLENELQKRVLVSETTFNLIGHYLRKLSSRLPLYNLYKIFSGYGEKPLWSTIWFIIISFLFGVFYLFNGLDGYNSFHDIKYSVNKLGTSIFVPQFWEDLLAVWFFSLSRLIPANYISSNLTGYFPKGDFGNLISFINFVVLFVLATFTFIGLKRHFRRF